MQFVDEQDHGAFLFRQFVEYAFQPLFKFTSEFRARNQGAHVQRQDSLVLEPLRHFAVDDALRQTLQDGGLANAGFADQHGIVLGATLQHLNGATNLAIPAYHRVELALLGALSEIYAETHQRLSGFLSAGIADSFAATQIADGILQGLFADTIGVEQFAEFTLVAERRQNDGLAGDEFVTFLLRVLVGHVEQSAQLIGRHHIATVALHLGQALHDLLQSRTQIRDREPRLRKQLPHRAALLVQQRQHEVYWFDEIIVIAHSK